MKAFNPQYKQRIVTYLEKQNFMHHIDFILDEIDVGVTAGWLKINNIHKQQKGLVHGGVIATVADIVAGFSAYTLVSENDNVVTGEIKISYLRPAKGNKLYAKGWVIRQGKRINFCEAEVWTVNGEERVVVAKASTSMITI